MEVLYPHCAGLAVHKETVVACVRHMTGGAGQGSAGVSRWNAGGGGTVKRKVRTFKTTTTDLLAFGVAGVGRLHACRDGGDRGLLEAGLAHPERRRLRADPGQRGARQERAGPQDRHQRRDLAGRSAGAWPGPRQFCARRRNAGATRSAAHPQATGARAGQPRPAAAADPGRRQYQARLRRFPTSPG